VSGPAEGFTTVLTGASIASKGFTAPRRTVGGTRVVGIACDFGTVAGATAAG
jgi:hypothetical protein